jgi:bacillithiol biosynthesis cysteine-adding enzyme BshC
MGRARDTERTLRSERRTRSTPSGVAARRGSGSDGQQAGLFLGPLYTVYKVASAIRWARTLASETGTPVVPMFWLQTEDHDLLEIAQCTLLRTQREPCKLSLPAAADSRIAIAHLALPVEIDACLATLTTELGQLPHASEHLERLARHYRAGASWADAFAGVLAELFEPEGLLLIDPRNAAFAPEAVAIHHKALVEAAEISRALVERGTALARAGFTETVHVRPDAPLSFFHAGGRHAPRHRLAACAHGFVEVGAERTHTRDALLAALGRDPLCFSTSALLRPILQDSLLPTAAYVGGPAEVSYFAQLAPLYAAFGLRMPLVVPRARLRVLEPSALRLLERLGLEPSASELPEDILLKRLAADGGERAQQPSPADLERALRDGFEQVLQNATAQIAPHAEQLAAQLAKTRDKLQLSATKLSEKYSHVLAHADRARVEDVRRLKRLLQPEDQPQERVYGLAYFAARYGERTFIEAVLAAIDPFDPTLRELIP